MVAPTPEEVRKARAYLQKRGIRTSDISPKDFAKVAVEMQKTFAATLKYIARLKLGYQGKIPPADTRRLVEEGKIKG